jgi:DNA gyrase subunit A
MDKEIKTDIVPVNIEDQMKESYLSYAMSVIIGRALPDVRDGLKPVHRRALYTMYELSNMHNKPYKKSARIVGDCIGKYHPHGDVAVYDTIVRMAQNFSLRYPLVDGQGNFGSIDGDPPAAMRYTEIRMSKIAEELLEDIDKKTVNFEPNYDESTVEPTLLPCKIPNLLINGSSGIAVGMATNIPPHNIKEVLDASISLIDNPEMSIDELIAKVPGPDFPTAGFIYGKKGIFDAYKTGRGIIQIRGKAAIEKMVKSDREMILITEIPYQVNKSRLLEAIGELVRDKKIQGISEIRDESDREGLRVVIELKKDVIADIVLNQLFKHTQLQTSFGIIMLALVDKQPCVLNLKEILAHFIKHRKEIVVKRLQFDLAKKEERLHIVEGLKIALSHIDEVISIIKKSKTPDEAKKSLCIKFNLSEIQSTNILEMRLSKLTSLEIDKLLEEHKELSNEISRLKKILSSEKLIFGIIKDEFLELKSKYEDGRRTKIVEEKEELDIADLIQKEDMVVTVTHTGYIKRTNIKTYRSQRRGGKGYSAMETKEEDIVTRIFVSTTHSHILFFTNKGRVYWLKVWELPEVGRVGRGKAIANILNMSKDEKICDILPVEEFTEGKFIVIGTEKGLVKKTDLLAYSRPRAGGIIGTTLEEGDSIIGAKLTGGTQEIFIATEQGKAIRFSEKDVRPMGRTAKGVIGIRLSKDDRVIGMDVLDGGEHILTVTENGYGKLTEAAEYRDQSRGGKGVLTMKVTEKNGKVMSAVQAKPEDELMIITNKGTMIRLKVQDISIIGRATQGVRLIKVDKSERVEDIEVIKTKEEGEYVHLTV